MNINKETISFLKTPSLILHVQTMHLDYESAKRNKKEHLKKFRDIKSSINQFRSVLQGRLKEMNRDHPNFFPVKSFVEYQLNTNNTIIKKLGRVVGHSERLVQVQFEGETYQTLVEPSTLKLLFIRQTY